MDPLNELNLLMRSRGLQSPSEDKGPVWTAPGQALKPENKQSEVLPRRKLPLQPAPLSERSSPLDTPRLPTAAPCTKQPGQESP